MFWSKEFLILESPISEDCLYLNVWTGAKQAAEKQPVLVYIYSGDSEWWCRMPDL